MNEEVIERFYESPEVCTYPDENHQNYHIEVQLPGVPKEKIRLKMHEDSFFISGETEDTVYIGSYATCCPIDPSKAKAVYKSGLLKVDVPFKEPEFQNVEIKIE